MEHAKRFLAKVVPWPGEDGSGWVDIYRTFNPASGTGDRLAMTGRPFKTMAPAISWIEWWRDKPDTNLYVCMSTQAMVSPKPTASGKPVAAKSAENALALRAVWIDVDVDARHFATTSDALDATTKFTRAIGIRPPTFFNFTSQGFQLFWVLEDAIHPDSWQVLANAMANATRMLGFVPLDSGLIHDRARLMRIPGTFNWKYQPRLPIWTAHQGDLVTYDHLRGVLAPYTVALQNSSPRQTTGLFALAGKKPSALFAGVANRTNLTAGVVLAAPTIDEVANGCPFIEETLQDGGASHREPVWYDALKVAYYTADPKDAAHRLSKGHQGYVPADTDAKLAHVAQDRQGKDIGWPQCDTIRLDGATQCARCPHLKDLKSPLNFAVAKISPQSAGLSAPPPAPPGAPPLTPGSKPPSPWPPRGYFLNPTGHVFKDPDKDHPTGQLVCGLPMWDGNITYDVPTRGGSSMIHFTAGLDSKRSKIIHIPYAALSDSRTLAACLHEQSFHVGDNDMKRFKTMLTSFIEQLHAGRHEALQSEDFGWAHEQGKPTAFVYGKVRWNCNGNRPVALSDHNLDEAYGQVGTLDNWKAACALITDQKIPALDAIVASSFAAPLVLLTGHSGMVVSAFSLESGVSKTAAMRVAQAVWSNPSSTMGGLDDTPNYVNDRLGHLRHLPFFYDEMHMQEHVARFVNLIFAMGQGKTKGRMNRSAVSQPVKTFATLLVAASNYSMVSYISEFTKMTTAGLYRVFEFPVPRNTSHTGMVDPQAAQQVIGNLSENYGHAGLRYAEYLGQNAVTIEQEVFASSKAISEQLAASQDERFWTSTMAVLLIGARYGNRLGLTRIDERRLLNFLLERFFDLRGDRMSSPVDVTKASNIEAHVANYVASRRANMIVTDRCYTAVGAPPTGFRAEVKFPAPGRPITGRISVRIATDDKMLRISQNDFKVWCREQGLSANLMSKQVLRVLYARSVTKASLGLHTPFASSTPREPLLEIDLARNPGIYQF